MSNVPVVKDFFHEDTNTFSYVVRDPATTACAIIDSVLDYDAASASTSTIHADKIIAYIKEQGLTVEWILETHVHADHLTAAQYLKAELGGKIAMSHKIGIVQETFGAIYHLDIKQWNAQQLFDYLFEDHESFQIGTLKAYNIPTPGHTPACLSYVIGDAVFVGDTLFMPDYGTARCDFPRGSAEVLFDSVQSLYQLPEDTRVFLCHDYLPETRESYVCETDIQTQKTQNIHIHEGVSKTEFAQMRNQRDSGLNMPKLILPSIQINMKAGQFPEPEQNGVSYLKLPLNYFK
ncbi:MBL fold metallo-hydrolase (plasmid) [Acinetobacter radioresistens]|jgi:glyoxylase-like metal-dependent hydrolase (beta-lactamase superfamily II)|uniref:MBL fold metallo-hydrolase n=1 Tax=Acinetobacter TaxID=469 RepID=UPI00044CE789|nr:MULTISPECIES: MBL fold metallo-hydrolase [Acinetobacter]EXB26581.1 metallo-beta-lactamase superfamily protein [Acinetobacter baumannii 1419130]NOJ68071.1 MBL fold metallo-hydrolase [Acinetobacter indicus]QCS13748.1 MBL fold metallo-hydrolase [Acinetobacter radioresistens]HEM7310919.1 MBL fold metallo-hydrolase [Acinetobacter baumannii]